MFLLPLRVAVSASCAIAVAGAVDAMSLRSELAVAKVPPEQTVADETSGLRRLTGKFSNQFRLERNALPISFVWMGRMCVCVFHLVSLRGSSATNRRTHAHATSG